MVFYEGSRIFGCIGGHESATGGPESVTGDPESVTGGPESVTWGPEDITLGPASRIGIRRGAPEGPSVDA